MRAGAADQQGDRVLRRLEALRISEIFVDMPFKATDGDQSLEVVRQPDGQLRGRFIAAAEDAPKKSKHSRSPLEPCQGRIRLARPVPRGEGRFHR